MSNNRLVKPKLIVTYTNYVLLLRRIVESREIRYDYRTV